MSKKKYITSLIICIGIIFFILGIVNLKVDVFQYTRLIIMAVAGLTAIDVFAYILNKKFQDNNKLLMGLALNKMMIKLLFTVAVIAMYYYNFKPESGYFVIPYIVIYLGFLGFEIYALSQDK